MNCILRIGGPALDVDTLAGAFPLKPYRLDHAGEPRLHRSHRGPFTLSAAHYDVPGTEGGDLPTQVAAAAAFLTEHHATIKALRHFPGVTIASLDFGLPLAPGGTHTDRLTPEFLALAGGLGLTLELTHYPTSDDREDS